jgi:hypothetical protein
MKRDAKGYILLLRILMLGLRLLHMFGERFVFTIIPEMKLAALKDIGLSPMYVLVI